MFHAAGLHTGCTASVLAAVAAACHVTMRSSAAHRAQKQGHSACYNGSGCDCHNAQQGVAMVRWSLQRLPCQRLLPAVLSLLAPAPSACTPGSLQPQVRQAAAQRLHHARRRPADAVRPELEPLQVRQRR